MSTKRTVAKTPIVLVSIIIFAAFVSAVCLTGLSINPAGAIAAVTVGVIGFVWFKKSTIQ